MVLAGRDGKLLRWRDGTVMAVSDDIMAGVDPAICDLLGTKKTWMAVTSTAMTIEGCGTAGWLGLAAEPAAPDLNRVPNIAIGRQMARIVDLTLNGRSRVDAVADNLLLLDYLREIVGLTGTKTGCDGGECGACTVLVDDRPRLSCLTLAAAMDGRRVDTIESLAREGRLSAVQRGFHEKLGSQCGYCTPGFIMASAGLLRRNPRPSEDDIRAALGSNICRCTGYVKIIEAVKYAAELHASGASP